MGPPRIQGRSGVDHFEDFHRAVGPLGLDAVQIADRLTLSEATVKTHVKRFMAKHNLTSRAQAVVVAYETGLVIPAGRHA